LRPSFATHLLQAGRHRYPHGAGAAGALWCFNDDDLHACAQGGRGRRGESTGCAGAWVL